MVLLIESGIQINVRDNNKEHNPIHIAALYNRIELVTLLIDNCCDLNPRNIDGQTPLIIATKLNHLDIVRVLVERGADQTVKDIDGKTAADYSIDNTNSGILEILEQNNINVNICYLMTALQLALRRANQKFANFLIKTGLRSIDFVNAIDYSNKKFNAYLLANFSNSIKLNAFKLALNTGNNLKIRAIIKSENFLECEIITTAIRFNQLKLIEFLLKNKLLDLTHSLDDDQTYLHFATKYGSKESLEMLITIGGMSINTIDGNGQTILFDMTMNNDLELIKLFIAKNGNINHQNKKGCSAVHVGMVANALESVALLIENGCEKIKSCNGEHKPINFKCCKNLET